MKTKIKLSIAKSLKTTIKKSQVQPNTARVLLNEIKEEEEHKEDDFQEEETIKKSNSRLIHHEDSIQSEVRIENNRMIIGDRINFYP